MIGRQSGVAKRVIIISFVTVLCLAVLRRYYSHPRHDLSYISQGHESQTSLALGNIGQHKALEGTLKDLGSVYDQKLLKKAPKDSANIKLTNSINSYPQFVGHYSIEGTSHDQTIPRSDENAPLHQNGQPAQKVRPDETFRGHDGRPSLQLQSKKSQNLQIIVPPAKPDISNHVMSPSNAAGDSINLANQSIQLNHFGDFPRPWYKPSCPQNLQIHEPEFSAIVYLTARVDSYTAQTVLALLDFSNEVSLTIKEIIFTYGTGEERLTNPEMDGTIEYLVKIVKERAVTKTVRGEYEWDAKRKGAEVATAKKVLVVDDTLIINRDSLPYLMHLLEVQPTWLHYPHIDSMLPVRIYGNSANGQFHPDNLIWQETSLNLYKITSAFTFKQYLRPDIREMTTPTDISSAALTGEVFVATKEHLLKIFSLMQTRSAAELSMLAWMCGDGIQATKCSIAVKTNNYAREFPKLPVGAKSVLEQLYPVDNFGKQVWKKVQDARTQLSCRESKWYFLEHSRTMDIPANKPAQAGY